jgi:glycosyltransferase involved in cell wall biosynthesis
MTPRVLMVSYFFPPLGGVGVQRTLKHATYLPDTGWTPVIIAPRGARYRLMDPAAVTALPRGLEVHRSLSYEPARLRHQLAHVARLLRGSPTAGGPAGGGPGGSVASGAVPGWLNRAWAAVVRALFFPDDQVLWIPFAVRSGLGVHRAQPCHAIYSSSPPISGHLVAGLLKRQTGLPWIADFRDPWIGNSYASPLPPLQRRLQARIERWIVGTADRVVVATPGLLRRYTQRYPMAAHRFVLIANGYDPADIGSEPAPRATEPHRGIFRLTYTGSVYGTDELPIFAEGLALALGRRPELRDRLRVEFIGWMTEPNLRVIERLRPGLGDTLETTGFLPRAVALARLRASDAGLILVADGPGRDAVITGKLFDYLGMDKPVLAVAPAGDLRALLQELHWGVVADPEPGSIADALLRLVDAPPVVGRADPEGRYDRRRLAAQLSSLLDEVTARSSPS